MSPLSSRRGRKLGKHADVDLPAPAAEIPRQGGGEPAAVVGVVDVATAERATGRRRIGELLVERGIVKPAAVTEALSALAGTGKRIGEALVDAGLLNDEQLAHALSAQLRAPYVDLSDVQPDPQAVVKVPENIAREYTVMPVRMTESGSLLLAIGDPKPGMATELAKLLNVSVELAIAPRRQVVGAMNRAYRALDGIDSHVEAFAKSVRGRASAQVVENDVVGDSPVVAIVERILTQALRDRASDVHIEPQDQTIRVRFRIDGALHDALSLPADIGPGLVSRLKILAGMNIVERRRPQDGQISTRLDGRDIDIRVATTATIWGETCVLRLLDKNRSLLRLGDLGMPDDKHDEFAKMARSPFGMVLCAGPTGSGKTTTLYATLAELNEPHRNIMTIEDPVEYVLPSINQIQMNETAGISFATGLKSILRQDPDVILVGEIRDVETARIAVQSALTGHFVLSSLHATDAVAALHRFLDMGIESFLIASSVLGVVGQRLVRRICPHCKEKVKLSAEEMEFYAASGAPAKTTFYAGVGCNMCSGTGYLDRIGVYELLRVTPEIKRLVVGWATQDELRRLAVSQGMRTLQDEALSLIQKNVTTVSEVMRAIYAF